MRNEELYLRECLDSVLAQIVGQEDVEILCVDGASTDRTREMVEEYAERDRRIRVLDNPQRIVPTGMNIGLRASKGAYLMRLDVHAEYPADYVEQALAALERTGADIIGGYAITQPGRDTGVARAIAASVSSRFGVGGSTFRTAGEEREVDTLPFGTYRRALFEQVGLFDERLVRNQDNEIYGRVRRHGGKVMVSPRVQFTYYARPTYARHRHQAWMSGVWNPYTIYIAGGVMHWRHFVPLFLVLSLIGLGVLGLWWRWAWWLLAGELTLYLALAGGASLQVAREKGVSAFLLLLAYVQLHFAYGVGSIWGILSAPFKWGLPPRPYQAPRLEGHGPL
jgi:glycosyltransferase involved in cell wall biosynthesis